MTTESSKNGQTESKSVALGVRIASFFLTTCLMMSICLITYVLLSSPLTHILLMNILK